MRAQKTVVKQSIFGFVHARIFKSRTAAEKFVRDHPPRIWRSKATMAPLIAPAAAHTIGCTSVIVDDVEDDPIQAWDDAMKVPAADIEP